MANRTVVVDLIVNTGKWTAGFQKASSDMASATTNAETKVRALQMQVGLLGVGMTAFAALAVKKWADFDAAMSGVAALGEDAEKNIKGLTEAAKSESITQMGYSATEAANSITELAKAGVQAEDIIGGGLQGAMSLAAIETMDAAESAQIMSSALTQFNLEGEQATHVADLIAGAAINAQGSAHDLGFALKQSGLVANQFGLSIEETTGTLAMFANAGLIGSDAGTSLRTMLLHLAGPSGKSAKLMYDLGFSAYDAAGNFKSMAEIANSLQVALQDKSEAEKNAALATIFGADATRAASLLLREGGDEVERWTEKVNKAGYASTVAFKRLDNLNGDLRKLGATFDKFMINLGSGADAPLRDLVQGITVAVQAFDEMPASVRNVVLALTGGGGLATLGVLATGQLFSGISKVKDGLTSAGIVGEVAAGRIAKGMKIATLAAGTLATAVTIGLSIWASKTAEARAQVDEWKSTLDDLGGTTSFTLQNMNQKLSEQHDVWWQIGEDTRSVSQIAEDYGVKMTDVQQAILGNEGAYDRVVAAMGKAHEGMAINSVAAGQWANGNEYLMGTIEKMRGEIEQSTTEKEREAAANEAAGIASEDAAQAAQEQAEAEQLAAEAARARADAITALVDSMHAQREAEEQMANEAADLRSSRRDYQAAIDAADKSLKENGKTLDENTEKGRNNADQLDATAEKARSVADAMREKGKTDEQVSDFLAKAHDQYVEQATAMGMAEDKAHDLANSLGLIKDVEIEVDADTAPARKEGESVKKYISRLQAQMAITADPSLAREAGESTGDYIDRLKATIEVDGGTAPARKDGESAQAYIDRLKSTIAINGDPSLAQQKGESAQAYIDRLTSTINVGADTSSAYASAAATAAAIGRMNATITVRERHVTAGNSASRSGGITRYTGGKLSGFARGGRLPGDPPQNPREDNILGLDMRGMPRAMIRSGEWIVSEPASNYYGDAFMNALNQRRIPKDALPGFAKGGKIDYTPFGHSLEYWQNAYRNSSDKLDIQIQIRDLKRDLREKEKGKLALRGLDRLRAEKDLRAAKEELRIAKVADRARAKVGGNLAAAIKKRDKEAEKREEARETARERSQSAREYRIAIGRGELKEDLTSGMSGVYGVVDAGRELISSGQVTGKAATRLNNSLTEGAISARKLYAQAEKIATSLEKARDKAEELAQIKENVASGIVGGFGLKDVEGTLNQWTGERATPTGQQFLVAAQQYAAKAKKFGEKLSALQKKGFSGVILQEIAGMGVEAGAAAADALLSLNTTDTKSLNTAFTDIEKWANYAGEAVTGGFYKGGLAAAQGIVKGLESQQKSVEKAIENMAKGMQDALKRALGIKSPSRVFRDLMTYVGDGAAEGLERQKAKVGEKASELLAVAGGRYTTGAMSTSVSVPYSASSAGQGASSAANENGVTKGDLQELAGMIVQGFETGTLRHLKRYTNAQNQNQKMKTGFRK